MSFELRPLSLGELLDRSFTFYRRHFSTFVGIMAAPSVMVLLVSVDREMMSALARHNLQNGDIGWVLAGSGLLIVLSIGYFVVYMAALGATTLAVSDLYRDRPITIAGSYAQMRGQIGSLVVLMLLTGLRVGGVAVAMLAGIGITAGLLRTAPLFAGSVIALIAIAGGAVFVFLMLRYALSVPALTLESVTPSEALGRSVDLTRNNLWRVFVLCLFSVVITYVSILIFQAPLITAAVIAGPESPAAFWLNLAGALTGAIASAISGPIMIIALAVLYYDVRIRHEGLDLEIMMDKLGSAPAAAPSGVYPA